MNPETSDPRDFFRLLWRRKWILIACVVLLPLATYLISTRLPETYQASTVIQLQAPPADPSLSGVGSFLGGADAQSTERVAALIQTNGVADRAAEGLGERAGSLRGDAQASADEDTGFITITAEASTAERAARVANAFADAVRVIRARQGRQGVDQAIENVRQQLEDAPAGDPATRDQLQQQLAGLRAARLAQEQNAGVIEAAVPPSAPASPDPARNAILALAAALLLGAGLVALVDRLDRRLHDPEDLAEITGAPVLVRLPPEAFTTAPGRDERVRLAFQMLRDSVTFFNVDSMLDSLVVVSSLKGEGKTTVAANLAMAYARTGKRIIVVDADLRSPRLGARLGVEGTPGLTGVLSGEADLQSALRDVKGFDGSLRVLPAGSTPPNPSELLSSQRMAAVFDQLKADSYLLIIDTPPLLLVSDAFALLERAAGALGVARLEETPKDAVARMASVVATVDTKLLGMVATGGTPVVGGGDGYGYGYGYGYAATNGTAPEPEGARGVKRIFGAR